MMNNDFNFDLPRRQSTIGVLVVFIKSVISFVKGLWLPILIIVYQSNFDKLWFYLFPALIFIVIIGIKNYLTFRNITFYVDSKNNEFVINSGIISKNRLSINLDKIQQVNLNQDFVNRILNVYSLEIDSAGSSDKEVSIQAIDHQTAVALRERLLTSSFNNSTINNTEESDSDSDSGIQRENQLLKVSLSSLLKIGVISNYRRTLVILFGIFITFFDNLTELIQNEILSQDYIDDYIKTDSTLGFFISLFIVFTLVFISNLIINIIKFFDFKIIKSADSLHINYGLFSKKNTILKSNKVHYVSYAQNFFQRKLDVMKLYIKQALPDSSSSESSVIQVPACSKEEKDAILSLFLSNYPSDLKEYKPNYRYLIIKVNLQIILPLLVMLLVSYLYPETITYYPIAILYFVLSICMIYFGFRNYRFYFSDNYILKRSGSWNVLYEIIQPNKVQKVIVKQMLWHQKPNIGHIVLETAAETITMKYLDFNDVQYLANKITYQIETSKKSWI